MSKSGTIFLPAVYHTYMFIEVNEKNQYYIYFYYFWYFLLTSVVRGEIFEIYSFFSVFKPHHACGFTQDVTFFIETLEVHALIESFPPTVQKLHLLVPILLAWHCWDLLSLIGRSICQQFLSVCSNDETLRLN